MTILSCCTVFVRNSAHSAPHFLMSNDTIIMDLLQFKLAVVFFSEQIPWGKASKTETSDLCQLPLVPLMRSINDKPPYLSQRFEKIN